MHGADQGPNHCAEGEHKHAPQGLAVGDWYYHHSGRPKSWERRVARGEAQLRAASRRQREDVLAQQAMFIRGDSSENISSDESLMDHL